MAKIKDYFTLRSSRHAKQFQCDYCDSNLIYSKYKIFIKLFYRKNPPDGADDLNIGTRKTVVYKHEYVKCPKCNAQYKIVIKGYKYYSRKYWDVSLEPLTDINKDFDLTLSEIINSKHYDGKIIEWHYTIENHNNRENRIKKFLNKLSFCNKLLYYYKKCIN